MLKYTKPKISSKRIKLNTFLSSSRSQDSFMDPSINSDLIAQGTFGASTTLATHGTSGGCTTSTYATTGT